MKSKNDTRPKYVKSYRMKSLRKLNVGCRLSKFKQMNNGSNEFTLLSFSKSYPQYPKYWFKVQKTLVSLHSVFIGSNSCHFDFIICFLNLGGLLYFGIQTTWMESRNYGLV